MYFGVAQMSVEELQRRITSGSVRAPNYFNGRLLSAGDLQDERDANRELLGRIGQAVGAGVAYGFEVSVAPTRAGAPRRVVHIRAGLAVGPYGNPLQLDTDIDLNVITVPASTAVTSSGAGFRKCQPAAAGVATVTNAGLHILAVGPASDTDGSVATSTLGSAALACAFKYEVSGLRFVLRPFDLALETKLSTDSSAAGGDAGKRSRFRSRVAQACLGAGPAFPPAPGLPDAAASPFGAVATVTDPPLPACHVPLALVKVADGGVEFVDMWAARRGLEAPTAAGNWGPWCSSQVSARGQAVVLQFQEHLAALLDELRATGVATTAQAKDYFEFLPPFGVVPVTNGAFAGFDAAAFFTGRASGLFSTRYTANASDPLPFLPRIDSDGASALISGAWNSPPAPNADGLFLQRYLIAPDTAAAPDSPLQVLFTLQDTNGPIEDDDVVEVLRDAADAYSSILSRAVLMPRPLTDTLIFGWAMLQAFQLAVVQSASLDATTGGLRGLDQQGVLSAFSRLFQVQKSLAQGALLDLPNDKNQTNRQTQVSRLSQLLDGPTGTSVPALGPSLSATPPLIPVILAAQNNINAEVRKWTIADLVGVRITFLNSSPSPIVADQAAQFKFNATSLVSAQLSLALSVSYPGRTPPPPWLATASFVQENGTTPLAGGRLDLKAGETRGFVMLLKAPATPTSPPLALGTSIDYLVNVSSNDFPAVTGSSGVLSFPVGTTPPQPDPNVVLAPGAGSSSALSGGTIKRLPNTPGVLINILATFKAAGIYTIGTPQITGSGWTAVRSTGTQPEITVGTGTLPVDITLHYTVTAGAAATDGTVEFPVQTKGGTAPPAVFGYLLAVGPA